MKNKKEITPKSKDNPEFLRLFNEINSQLSFNIDYNKSYKYSQYFQGLTDAERTRQFEEFFLKFKLFFSQRYSVENLDSQIRKADDIDEKLRIIEDFKSEFAEFQVYIDSIAQTHNLDDFTISRGFEKILKLRKKGIVRLKKNSQHEGKEGEEQEEIESINNPYPKIFTDKGFRLFEILVQSHITDNSHKRNATGFSEIYHYLRRSPNKHEYIRCTQQDYIKHLRELGYSISKIQPKTSYYEDNVVFYFNNIVKK